MTNEEFFADWNERTNRFLKHARGVVHIGAHEGQEAPLYAERELPVLWVEAAWPALNRLALQIVEVYPEQRSIWALLVDTDDQEYEFFTASNKGQSSSIYDFHLHSQVWPEVKMELYEKKKGIRFDTLVSRENIDLSRYNAAVLDVQAAELLVLKGMGDTLSAFDWIRCECADFEIYKGGCQYNDLDDYLDVQGYVIARMDTARRTPGIGSCYEALWVKQSVWDALSEADRQEIYRKSPTQLECEAALFEQTKPQQPLHTISTDGKNNVKVYAAMSSGRLGFQSTGDCIYAGLGRFNIPLGRNEGAFWHHGLQLSIEEGLRLGADFILTIDHDTIFQPADIAKLVTFLLDNPQIGAAVPLQQRREGGNLLATSSEEVDMSVAGVPIAMGHFGLTLFRRSVFEKLSKPWFYEQPDPNGSWGNYRVDADMGFWHKCQEAEIWVYLCLDVVVGHLELVATYPDQDLKTKYCNLSQVRSGGFAAPAGVFDRKQAKGMRSLNMCTPEELQFPQIKPQEATA